MLTVLRRLHGMAERPLPFNAGHCAGSLARAIGAEDWLALVVDLDRVEGLLVASVGATTISPALVAVEHAWIAPGGWGAKLAAAYETWARERGCVATHLSMAPGSDRLAAALDRRGYAPAEISMVKVL